MSNKFKCPVCQNNLHKINVVVSTCTNDKCKLWGSSIPNLVLDALIQAKQDLEQSEKCCSAWEIQALDYKAETIALSGKLEIATKALKWLGNNRLAENPVRVEQLRKYARNTLETIGKHNESIRSNINN